MALLPGLVKVEIKTFRDHRGYFRETYQRARLEELLGRPVDFVQDNESMSLEPGVVRGLHFQIGPMTQAKLVRVVSGAVYDVAVDLRSDSPTYGQWSGLELSADNGLGFFVPEGFAHGFCTLAKNTVVTYKVSAGYAPECESGLLWNDPALGIDWPFKGAPVINDRDASWPTLSQLGQLKW